MLKRLVLRGSPAPSGAKSGVGEERTSNDERRTASDAFSVHALTDVTGFGLIGHAREMALASNVGPIFDSANIPILEGTLEATAGYIPGGLSEPRFCGMHGQSRGKRPQ